MNREELLKLVEQTPQETWKEQDIHDNTKLDTMEHMDYKEVKQTFEDLFVSQLKAYKHSALHGLDEFKIVDSMIGCTQYIDNLYQSQPKNFYVFQDEYHYHTSLKMKNVQQLDTLPAESHVLVSVPHFNNQQMPIEFDKLLKVAEERNCSVHLDLAWWTISRGLKLDISHDSIKSIGTSLSKPFSLSKNRIGIRMRRDAVEDSISVQNDMKIIPWSLLKLGLNYLQQNKLDYMWDRYGESYDHFCRTAKMRPSSIFFLAAPFGKGNRHINLALREVWRARKDSNLRPQV